MLQYLQTWVDSKVRINPMAARELSSRMRSPRAYAILTVYMAVVSGITMLIYLAAFTNNSGGVNDSSRVGAALFYIVVGMQVLLVSFVSPAFTTGGISGERERGSYDLLRLTLLTPRQIVISKLVSAFGYTALLVCATIPLVSLSLLLGGVELGQLIAALVSILAAALLFSTLGLFISSRMQTTLGATIITYAITLGVVLGMAVLTLIALPVLNGILYGTSPVVRTSPFLASLLQMLLFVLISISPLSALVASEANIQDSGNVLIAAVNPLPGTTTPLVIPAPFAIMTVLYLLVSVLLIWLTIRRIARADDHA
jgi:ABC-type transport system involved in multi-copper enzyme maturation permease subunit